MFFLDGDFPCVRKHSLRVPLAAKRGPIFVRENRRDEAQLRELVFGYPNRPRHLFMAPKPCMGGRGRPPGLEDACLLLSLAKDAASTSDMSRFETEMLSSRVNLTALMNLSGTWIDSVHGCAPLDKLILDLDSSVSETHGQQQGSAYNGYLSACAIFRCSCSTSTAIWNGPCSGVATTTAPSSGVGFCFRSSTDTGIATYRSTSVRCGVRHPGSVQRA